ncbi:MauE/DoxX family redox-associated membrane protein [Pimelobacter simplex]|nr:hypothetical protein NSI01_30990 [Pimelobacter simplex]
MDSPACAGGDYRASEVAWIRLERVSNAQIVDRETVRGRVPVTWVVVPTLLVPSALLVWSAVLHLAGSLRFHAVLVAHQVLPYRLTGAVATVFPVVELVLGLLGTVLAVASGAGCWGPARAAIAASVAAVYLAMAGYVARQLRTAPGAPCGCFAGGRPSSVLTVLRALGLGLLAGVAGLIG